MSALFVEPDESLLLQMPQLPSLEESDDTLKRTYDQITGANISSTSAADAVLQAHKKIRVSISKGNVRADQAQLGENIDRILQASEAIQQKTEGQRIAQAQAQEAAAAYALQQIQSQVQAQDDSEVLAAGEIMRAPLPMGSVLAIEDASGAQQGAYFIELMRRRLTGLLGVQEKWISRLCNQKHAKHIETQLRIRDFMQAVIDSYELRFGKSSDTMMTTAPIRRRKSGRGGFMQ